MDSLNNYINAAINDTDKVMRINKAYFDNLYGYNSPEPYKMLKKALDLSVKINFKKGEMKSYANMAGYCRNHGNISFSYKFSMKYRDLALENNDSITYARALGSMAIDLRAMRFNDSSLAYTLKAHDILLRHKADKDLMARIYSQLGGTYGVLGKDSLAIDYALKALALRQEINYGNGIDASLGQVIGFYEGKNDYKKMLEYAQIGLENRRKFKDSVRIGGLTNLLGFVDMMTGKKKEGMEKMLQGLRMIERQNAQPDGTFYLRLSKACESMGDDKGALKYYKLFKEAVDRSISLEMANSVGNVQAMYDLDEKEKTIGDLDREKNLQRYIIIFTGVVLLVIVFASIFIYRAYKQKKTANILLAEQKKLIEERNKEVMDSINYAKRLQGAILFPESELLKHFTDAFILFKPKDVVSGDFYWFSESPQNRIIAVADCTGHGVPGGFMSMLGYESFQDVALKENITTTSQALKSLDKKMTEALNKSDKSFRDGMDAALCAFSKKENKLLYSGANRPLIQISENVLTEHKPDKNTIGGDIDNADKQYTTKTIEYKKGDVFYMFTDGYPDQFGGTKLNSENSFGLGKKFKYKNLLNLLLSINTKSLREQKQLLEENFEDWKGTLEQVDDVCIIGLRV